MYPMNKVKIAGSISGRVRVVKMCGLTSGNVTVVVVWEEALWTRLEKNVFCEHKVDLWMRKSSDLGPMRMSMSSGSGCLGIVSDVSLDR